MKDILFEIVENKRQEIALSKQQMPIEQLIKECKELTDTPRSARHALANSPTGIIAEFKRRSPSKGWIHESADVREIVDGYANAGASVCSILTDKRYFGGSLNDLRQARSTVDLPLLRKDFMIDPYQLYEARLAGADLVLLIASCLSIEECASLAHLAHQLGMEVLLEIHSKEELSHLNPHIDLLGVNNRNLGTFHTEIQTSFELAQEMEQRAHLLPQPPLLVSESGLSLPQTITQLQAVGFKGFLMGEAFMKEANPANALQQFMEKLTQSTPPLD